MMEVLNKIENIMNNIEYGFLDRRGINVALEEPDNWEEKLYLEYHLLDPLELLEKKVGHCWDQVELERYLFNKEGVDVKTYFICTYDNDNLPSHTILSFSLDDGVYWFEHSWDEYAGVHRYDTEEEMLKDVKRKFILSHRDCKGLTFVYEYSKPLGGIGVLDFYKHCENGRLIKLNEPLYFYHVVNKDADMSKGLISLKYMYDRKMFDLFDKYTDKYKKRIVKDWQIEKYECFNEDDLTREDILDGLEEYRGEFGSSYIYFFKYAPYKELGSKIDELLKYKDIYRININDEEVQRDIKDIFWGYNMSNSDNNELDYEYYKKISKEEYFENYDDNLEMNFSRLNHISVAFINDYCPREFLERVDNV